MSSADDSLEEEEEEEVGIVPDKALFFSAEKYQYFSYFNIFGKECFCSKYT